MKDGPSGDGHVLHYAGAEENRPRTFVSGDFPVRRGRPE